MKFKKAFTLIELLVVIAIIGLLATISVIALNNARAKGRDAKRVADVKQMQTALELYFNDMNRYPSETEFNSGAIASYSNSTGVTTTYMAVIPMAPTPPDGNCTDSNNNYTYHYVNASNYRINFCLGGAVGSLGSGGIYAADPTGFSLYTPAVIAVNCNDIHQECDPSCPIGSTCGGGTLFSRNPNLVAAPSMNSESGCVHGQDCTGRNDSSVYLWGPISDVTNAVSTDDGRLNMAAIKAHAGANFYLYPAAKACDDINSGGIFGFSDWYFPAANEMLSLWQNFAAGVVPGVYRPDVYYLTSTELGASVCQSVGSWGAGFYATGKNGGMNIRCIRRF